MILHELFTKNNINLFEKNNNLSAHVFNISMNAILEINNKLYNSKNGSFFLIDQRILTSKIASNKIDILHNLINLNEIHSNQSRTNELTEAELFVLSQKAIPNDDDGYSCTYKYCESDSKNSYCYRTGNTYPQTFACTPQQQSQSSCLRNTIKDKLSSTNAFSQDSSIHVNNDSLHYGLKTILKNSALGTMYTSYYAYLSEVYKDKITVDLGLKTARILYRFNSQLQKILNSSNNGQEVLLTSNMKNELISLINDYKILYNDLYVDALLDNDIVDLNNKENKTIAQIVTEL